MQSRSYYISFLQGQEHLVRISIRYRYEGRCGYVEEHELKPVLRAETDCSADSSGRTFHAHGVVSIMRDADVEAANASCAILDRPGQKIELGKSLTLLAFLVR